MIDERQGKSNISQKELSRLRNMDDTKHICFADLMLILQKASA